MAGVGSGRGAEKEKPVPHQSIEKLAEYLNISVKNLRTWFESDHWRPLFDEFFNEAIKPLQDEAERTGEARQRRFNYNTVQAQMIDGEAHGRTNYSGRFVNIKKFSDVADPKQRLLHQYAYFMCVALSMNTTSRDGIFYDRHDLSEHQRFVRMWSVLEFDLWKHTKSQLAKAERTRTNQEAKERKKQADTVQKGTTPKRIRKQPSASDDSEKPSHKRRSTGENLQAAAQSMADASRGLRPVFTLPPPPVRKPTSRLHTLYDKSLVGNIVDGDKPVPSGKATSDSDENIQVKAEADDSAPLITNIDAVVIDEEMVDEDLDLLAKTLETPQSQKALQRFRENVQKPNTDFAEQTAYMRLSQKASDNFDIKNPFWRDVFIIQKRDEWNKEHTAMVVELIDDDDLDMQDLFRTREVAAGIMERLIQKNETEDTLPYDLSAADERIPYANTARLSDNPRLQLQGYEHACTELGLDPARPRFMCMPLSMVLLRWQVLGIAFIVRNTKTRLSGVGILDTMGLGKTVTGIGYLLERLYRRERLLQAAEEHNEHFGPVVVLTLTSLIFQWQDELLRMVGNKCKVYVYFGDMKVGAVGALGDKPLTKDSPVWNDPYAIILSTTGVWNARNGVSAQKDWRMKVKKWSKKQANKKPAMFILDPDFPNAVPGKVSVLIIDECHTIKNPTSGAHVSCSWIKPQTTVLLSAHPDPNSVQDIEGMIPFVEPRIDRWADSDWLEAHGASRDSNPFRQPFSDDTAVAKWLRPTRPAVKRFILSPSLPPEEQGESFAALLQSMALRRTYLSKIDGEEIGKSLPAIKKRRIETKFTDSEKQKYDQISSDPMRRLVTVVDGRAVWSWKQYRRLLLYATWTGFSKLHKDFTAKKCASLYEKDHLLHHITQKFCRKTGRPAPAQDEIGAQVDIIYEGAPKLRALVENLRIVNGRMQDKVMLVGTLPGQQLLIFALLQALGFNIASYHAGLSAADKYAIQEAFTKKDSPAIVIGTFKTIGIGGNWQLRCHWVMLVDPSTSLPAEEQVIGRIYRIGQLHNVEVVTFYLQESINDRQLQKNLQKAFPGTLARMNSEMFGLDDNKDEDAANESAFVTPNFVRLNGTLHRADSPSVEGKGLDEISGTEVVHWILQKQTGLKFEWSEEPAAINWVNDEEEEHRDLPWERPPETALPEAGQATGAALHNNGSTSTTAEEVTKTPSPKKGARKKGTAMKVKKTNVRKGTAKKTPTEIVEPTGNTTSSSGLSESSDSDAQPTSATRGIPLDQLNIGTKAAATSGRVGSSTSRRRRAHDAGYDGEMESATE